MSSDLKISKPTSPTITPIPLQLESTAGEPSQLTTFPHSSNSRTMANNANLIHAECRLIREENYSIWSFIVEQVLRREGLWHYVEEAPLSIERQSSKAKNNWQKTLVILTFFAHVNLFTEIKTEKDPHSLWKVLKTMMVSTNQSRKNNLLNRLFNTQLSPNGSMKEFL